jgi:pimeloyl-ACP methyl ester carboxylesterase
MGTTEDDDRSPQPQQPQQQLQIQEKQTKILDWPTDTLSIDYKDNNFATHTVIILFPGNPGQYDWYVSDLTNLVLRLGRGYAARGISHAGHGLSGEGIVDVEKYSQQHDDADVSIPWTIRGQVLHKCAYLDAIMSEFDRLNEQSAVYHDNDNNQVDDETASMSSATTPVRFIFMGHSFGCHVIQQLCMLRYDIIERTDGFLYLMPFIRMKAGFIDQTKLNLGASSPDTLIRLGTIMSRTYRSLPKRLVSAFVKLGVSDENSRDIAVRLLRQPTFVKNFFTLGTEEIRDIPKDVDVSVCV